MATGHYSSERIASSGSGSRGAGNPHELRRRLRAHLGPRVGEVVLDGRMRQAGAVGSESARAWLEVAALGYLYARLRVEPA